ncbi:MAG: hypothetical protein AAF646_18030 [Pseudomonadota bacterium]
MSGLTLSIAFDTLGAPSHSDLQARPYSSMSKGGPVDDWPTSRERDHTAPPMCWKELLELSLDGRVRLEHALEPYLDRVRSAQSDHPSAPASPSRGPTENT